MSRWVIVDDTDSGIQYSGTWFQDQSSQNYLGNYGVPYLSTLHGTHSNGSFSYIFEGTKVNIVGTVQYPLLSDPPGPDYNCTIDGTTPITSIPYNDFRENRLLLCFTDTTLDDGMHNITVEVTVPENETFWLDYVQYLPSADAVLDGASISVDYTDSALVWSAGWVGHNPGQITQQTGSNVSFSFQGVSLTWLGFYDNTLPLSPTTASYSIDGQDAITFQLDGTAATSTGVQYNQQFFQTPALLPGNHTVQVTYHGNAQTAPLSLFQLDVQGSEDGSIVTGTSGDLGLSIAPTATGPSTTPTSGANAPSPFVANAPSSSSNNIGPIVGGILGGLTLLVAAVVAILFWRRRRSRQTRQGIYIDADTDMAPFHQAPSLNSIGHKHSNSNSTTTFSYPSTLTPSESESSPMMLATTTSPSSVSLLPKPSSRKALEASRGGARYNVANSTITQAHAHSHSPSHSSERTFDYELSRARAGDSEGPVRLEFVREEDSGMRFSESTRGQGGLGQEHMRVDLPPDYTPQ